MASNILLIGLPTPGLAQLAETLGISAAETADVGDIPDQPLDAGAIFPGLISQKPVKGNRHGNHLAYLMVYAAPADFLARQVTDGAGALEVPEENVLKALQFWREYHQKLLDRYRQTEASAMLINGDRPISIDSLASRLGSPVRRRVRHVTVSTPLRDQRPPVDFPASYLQIIDTVAPECLELYMDLESCAELMGREPEFKFSGPDQRLAQARELLRLIAQTRQSERAYQTEIQSLQDQCTHLHSSTAALAAEKASLQNERDSALHQLRGAQDALEQHRLAYRTSEELLTKTKAENAKLIAERDAEVTRRTKEQSQTQALSKQLNAKLSASEAENKALQNENEMLLLQLHQVQEELERYYLLHQKDEHDIEVLRKEVDARPEPLWKRLRKNGHEARTGFFGITTSPLNIGGRLFGAAAKRKRAIRRAAQVLRQSGAFDEQWYLQHYPDVAKAGFDPIVHYLKFGSSEGRNPSAEFDTRWYLNSNPDVVAADINPLLHYVKFGKGEGRHPMKTRT